MVADLYTHTHSQMDLLLMLRGALRFVRVRIFFYRLRFHIYSEMQRYTKKKIYARVYNAK